MILPLTNYHQLHRSQPHEGGESFINDKGLTVTNAHCAIQPYHPLTLGQERQPQACQQHDEYEENEFKGDKILYLFIQSYAQFLQARLNHG